MNNLRDNESQTLCGNWWQTITRMLDCQWNVCAGHYQLGLEVIQEVLHLPTLPEAKAEGRGEVLPPMARECQRLERQAAERVRQGLAPPKTIYEVPYRERIDWSQFPEWARPTDPELFQGCGHEG